jgi:hypothetical protein
MCIKLAVLDLILLTIDLVRSNGPTQKEHILKTTSSEIGTIRISTTYDTFEFGR